MDQLWYNYDLSDAREIVKCVKQIQKVCRDSLEYDEWQRHCKYKDAKICPICNDDYYEVNAKCESHHHPKTLYDVVEDILDDHMEKNDLDDFSAFDICVEVMDLHSFGKVSYINLCQHCHKKYHAGHPDVVNKMTTIFEQRVLDAQKNEVKEEVEEVITIGNIVSTQSNIKESDKQTIKFIDSDGNEVEFPKAAPPLPLVQETENLSCELLSISDSIETLIEEKSLIEVPKVLEHKDFSNLTTLNIETTNDFIAIDINDL